MSRLKDGNAHGTNWPISRRRFLHHAGATGVVVGTGGFSALLAACDTGDDETASDSFSATDGAPITVDGVEPIYGSVLGGLPRGGRLNVALGGQSPPNLDPFANVLGAIAFTSGPVHDWIESYDENLELVPSLAKTFEQVDDRTLEYTLHDGARFHSGEPVTSQDIKALFEWIQDEKNASWMSSLIQGVTVKVVDDATFQLKLDKPNAALRANLPYIPIVRVADMPSQKQRPIGCGPFTFKRWVKGSYAEYASNPDYWNKEAPRLDMLKMSVYPDEQSMTQAFHAGQIDWITPAPTAQASALEARAESGEFKVDVYHAGTAYVAMNHARKPFDDPRVRRAVALCMDREAMVQGPGGGVAKPTFVFGIAPDHPWYPKELEFEREVDEARRLLAEAGYPDGLDAGTFLAFDAKFFEDLSVIAQGNLEEIGIRMKLRVIDAASIVEQAFEQKDYSISVFGDANLKEPAVKLEQYLLSTGGSNIFNYRNEKTDDLLNRARTTLEPAKRKPVYHEAYRELFVVETAIAPLVTEPHINLYKSHTNGDQYSQAPIGDRLDYPIMARSA